MLAALKVKKKSTATSLLRQFLWIIAQPSLWRRSCKHPLHMRRLWCMCRINTHSLQCWDTLWYVRDVWNLTQTRHSAALIKFRLLFLWPLSRWDNLLIYMTIAIISPSPRLRRLLCVHSDPSADIQAWLLGDTLCPNSMRLFSPLSSLLCRLPLLSSFFIICWFFSPPHLPYFHLAFW